jgi:DNA-binding LytR/AlgR family response regulator
MKTIIIEDELLAAKNLTSILNEIGGVDILAYLESITESVEWLESNAHPDLIFMDIHLADGSSFEIFDKVIVRCPVIFTTAYDEYAIKAFKVNSIDYLLKPIDLQAVKKALIKYQSLTSASNMTLEIKKMLSQLHSEHNYKTNLLLFAKGDKLVPLPVEEIAYIFIDNGIVKAVDFEEKPFVIDQTLDDIATELNPSNFYRANRQFIVARKAVKDMDLWFNSRLAVNLKVKTSERIIISKLRSSKFKEWLSSH